MKGVGSGQLNTSKAAQPGKAPKKSLLPEWFFDNGFSKKYGKKVYNAKPVPAKRRKPKSPPQPVQPPVQNATANDKRPPTGTLVDADPNEPVLIDPNETAEDPSLPCNQKLLGAYGLKGMPRPHSVTPKKCPKIVQTCCSAEDEDASDAQWASRRGVVEAHYNAVLSFYRLTLGFADQILKTARDLYATTDVDCQETAKDMLLLNINRPRAEEMIREINKTMVSVAAARKGFFCSICDLSFHLKFAAYSGTGQHSFDRFVFYSTPFCSQFVEATITGYFQIATFMKRYLENFVILGNCKAGTRSRPTLNVGYPLRQAVKNCLRFRQQSSAAYFCEPVCRRFSLTGKSELIDGNLDDLAVLYQGIKDTLDKAVESPASNFLARDSVSAEMRSFESNAAKALEKKVFFESVDPVEFDFAKMTPKITLFDGVDVVLLDSASKYELDIKGVSIVRVVFWSVAGWLLVVG